MKVNINSFNVGEVTPLLAGRTDLESLKRAAVQMRNFLPVSTGGAIRRPSLMHLAVSDTQAAEPPITADPSVHSRLIPFTYSTGVRYMIQISSRWMKIFGSDGTLKQSLPFGLDGGLTSLAGCTTTLGSTTVTCASTAALAAGMYLTGAGVPAGTTVASITDATTFVLSQNAMAAATGLALLASPQMPQVGCATSTSGGTTTVTCTSTAGLAAGMTITGAGIAATTTIASVTDATTFVLSAGAMADGATSDVLLFASVLTALAACATSAGSTTVSCASTAGLAPGMGITGTGIPYGSTIAGITDATRFVLSQKATGSALALLAFQITPLTGCTISTSGTPSVTTVTCASTSRLIAGMTITGSGIPASTTIASISDANHFVLSQAATGGTGISLSASPVTALTYGVTVAGRTTVTCASTVGLAPGMSITGLGIPLGTTIAGIIDTFTLMLSQTASADGADLSFYATPVTTLTGCSTTSGSTTVACPNTAWVVAGMSITGAGIPACTTILSITPNTSFILSQAATATATGLALPASFVISLTACTTLTGTSMVSCANTAGLAPGMSITGLGIAAGTVIASVTDATSFVLNQKAGASATVPSLLASPLAALTNCTTGIGSTAVSCPSTIGLAAGMSITGTGLIDGTTIASITDATHLVLSQKAAGLALAACPLTMFAGCGTTAGSATVTCANTTGLATGMYITGTGIPAGAIIVSITPGTSFALSQMATATGTGIPLLASPLLSLAGCTTNTAGSPTRTTTVTCANTAGLVVGMTITGTGIAAGATIASITPNTTFVLSPNAMANGSVTGLALQASPLMSVTGCATTMNSTTVTCTSSAGLVVGMTISGTGIPAGAVIVSIPTGASFVLSAKASATLSSLTLQASPLLTVTGCTTLTTALTVACTSTAALVAGMQVTGAGIAPGTTVASITDATHFVLSTKPGTAHASFTLVVSPVVPVLCSACATTMAGTIVTCASTAGLAAGMCIAGAGIAAGTTIASVTNTNSFALSQNATANGAGLSLLALPQTTLANCATTNGSSTVACTSTLGLVAGTYITGTGVAAGTTIASVTDPTHFVLSQNATATGTGLALVASLQLSLTGCATTTGSTTVTCDSTAGLATNLAVVGAGIPAGATIASLTPGVGFNLSQNATATRTKTALALLASAPASPHWPSVGAFNVDEISFSQVNDVLFLAHQAFPTLMLSCYGDTDWRLSSFATDFRDAFWPPMLDEQVTSTDLADVVETGWSDSQHFTGARKVIYGGLPDHGSFAAGVISAPGPATFRLYTAASGTVPFNGTIAIQGADSYGLITLTGCTINAGSRTVTCASTAGLVPGLTIIGTGIASTTTIASVTDARHFVLSRDAIGSYSALRLTTDTTWTTLYTISGAALGAQTLREEWWHNYNYLRLSVTYNAGALDLTLKHVGSLAAPTFWGDGHQYVSGGDFILNSSPPAFATYSPGEALQIGHLRRNNASDIILRSGFALPAGASTLTSRSPEFFVLGDWEAYSTGIWTGQVYLEQKDSTGRWDVIRTWSGLNDYNFTASGTLPLGQILRLRSELTSYSPATGDVYPRFSLKAADGLLYQWGRVSGSGTSQVNFTPMNGADLNALCQGSTYVSRAAMSPRQTYPACVCIHDERVYLAGTSLRPTYIWASTVDDLLNFRRTGFNDGSFAFQIAANEGNPIQSLISASQGIILLTAGDEWLVNGADTGITPTNISARRQSRYGSAAIQAIPAAGSLLFVQRGAVAIHDYQFQWTSQIFDAPELTELVKHLTPSGIRCMAYSRNPEGMIWAVTNDGQLLTCSYNRTQQVIAWAAHPTAGTFESVAVTYGSTAGADDVWFVVKRNGRRHLERLDSAFWANLYNGGALVHLDSCATMVHADGYSMYGMERFEAQSVWVLKEGVWHGPFTATDGEIVTDFSTTDGSSYLVGAAFTSTLQPMPFDIALPDGTMQGRQVQTPTASIRLYRTKDGSYQDSPGGPSFPLKLPIIAPATEFTGVMPLRNMAKVADAFQMAFTVTSPMPMNVLSVIPSINVYG